jgi:small neutral amino acid transporter SnatA (MarC family)
MHVPSSLLSSFVMLFVTIGPTETAVNICRCYLRHTPQRAADACPPLSRPCGTNVAAFCGARQFCAVLAARLPASISRSGGLLLFLQALTLTFSSRGLSSIKDGERRDAEKPGDIAVFPLAFPLIASPGRSRRLCY